MKYLVILLVLIGSGISSVYASEETVGVGNTTIEVSIGDPIDERGLRPITITQMFFNAEKLDKIQVFDFGLDNNNKWKQHTQEQLPDIYRIFEIYGKKKTNNTITKLSPEPVKKIENIPNITYTMNCQYMNSTIHTNTGQTYTIPKGFSKVMVKQSDVGILPVEIQFAKKSQNQYLLDLASFYKQKIIAPKNSIHTMFSDETCKIDFQGFKTGHYSYLGFIFADNLVFQEGIHSKNGATYPLLAGKEALITIDLKDANKVTNTTKIRAGYAIEKYNGTNIIPHPPIQEASEEEQQKYAMSIPKYIEHFHNTASFQDYQDFEINSEIPDIATFSFIPPETGQYSFSIYTESFPSEFPSMSSSQRGFVVVKEPSKALREYGQCKSFELQPVAKPDYSEVVCVSSSTSNVLKQRGWH